MDPLVSVIVPNYNHARFLRNRLDSIYNQSYQNFEVILLDDCSTDESQEILEEYRTHPKTSQLIVNEENSGSTFSQWKKGLELASGDLIWIAESDDYCQYDLVEKLIEPFERDDKLVVSYCNSNLINDQGAVFGTTFDYHTLHSHTIFNSSRIFDGKEFLVNYMLAANLINNASAVLFKSSVLHIVGYPNERMRQAGDYDLWVRILHLGDVYYHRGELNFFRKGSQSVTVVNHGKEKWVINEIFAIVFDAIRRIGKEKFDATNLNDIFLARMQHLMTIKEYNKEFYPTIFDMRLLWNNHKISKRLLYYYLYSFLSLLRRVVLKTESISQR